MQFLGNIVCPAATGTNNRTTATPFDISGFVGVEVRTTGSDVYVELVDNAAGTYATTTAKGFPLAASSAIGIASNPPGGVIHCKSPLVACYSATGAAVQVWGLWG